MKFLISAYSGLGNTIQLTSLIKSIESSEKDHEILFISDDKYSQLEILKDEKVKTIKSLKPSVRTFFKIRKQIAKERFDVIFLPFIGSPGWLLILAISLFRPRIVSHIQDKNFSKLFVLKFLVSLFLPNFKSVKFEENKSEIDSYKDLFFSMEEYSVLERNGEPCLTIKNNEYNESLQDLNNDYICFQYGVYNGRPSPKMWKDTNCNNFFASFLDEYPKKYLVLVGDGKIKKSDYPNHPRLINLINQTNLQELKLIVKKAKLMICMDSALMHLANALGIPLIAIYGPTNSSRTFPKREGNFKIQSQYHIEGPCDFMANLSETEAIKACGDCKQFMKDISANDVLKLIKEKGLLS